VDADSDHPLFPTWVVNGQVRHEGVRSLNTPLERLREVAVSTTAARCHYDSGSAFEDV
jgi:hypothetical protein